MQNFDILYNDTELNSIISTINDINKKFRSCHGKYHVDFVIRTIEYILQALSYDKKIIELGKIAGLLHDIGNINGKKEHAKRSAKMCIKFLDKTNLTLADKEIIIHAIADHSNGDNISSAVGAALLIADKIDLSKDRVLPAGYNHIWHMNLLEISKIDIAILNNIVTINYITTNKFCKEIHVGEWSKGISVPIKASKYLNCNCIFMVNGVETLLH